VDTVRLADLKELAGVQAAAAISLYLPTESTPDTALGDALRLKALLEQAAARLEAQGVRRAEAERLLAPASRLPEDKAYWSRRNRGLAIFLAPGVERTFRVPLACDERVTVGQRLQLKPLLPIVDRGERFLLLALSQKQVRFFEATRTQIREVAVRDLPRDARSALNYATVERGEQVHSAMHVSQGKQAAVFHGQGGQKDTAKEDLGAFFEIVARALEPTLAREKAPLLLAGVDYLLPIFRQHCSYPELMARHLAGNCDQLSAAQLLERSWEIMQFYFDRPRQEALSRLQSLLGTGKAAADTASVVAAAATGKVEVLFLDPSREVLGSFDAAEAKAAIGGGREDLVNLALLETLLHGGTAYAAQAFDLPPGQPVAAIYRY